MPLSNMPFSYVQEALWCVYKTVNVQNRQVGSSYVRAMHTAKSTLDTQMSHADICTHVPDCQTIQWVQVHM